jgi:hypothetical protein
MRIRDLVKKLTEGGNLASHKGDGTPMPGWQGIPGQHQSQELDLRVHDRSYVVQVLSDLLHKINDLFAQQFKEPLWHENSVAAQKFLSGSTAKFFDKKISDEEFVRVKPTVGDIDTQAPDKHAETIKQFLTGLIGKKVGDTTFIGFSPGNNQYTSMWQVTLNDLPVKLQIDFEYGEHEEDTGLPTPWQDYSHSSAWEDLSAGIKGVFHKYIDRALPYAANVSTKYVARVLKKSTKISDEPVTDSDYSFAVSGQGGGGVSQKYIPYNDPNTGEPMEKDGIPVMQLLPTDSRQYIKNLAQQFEIFFGEKPNKQDQQLKNSFIGTVQLATKYLDDNQRTELFRRFVSICFEPGSQMITKNDPVRDRDTKMAAIDYMVEHLKLPNAQGLRKEAINTAMAYEQAFTSKKAKDAGQTISEADEQPAVKAQLRKGMPHLRNLKPADFLDLVDELRSEGGRFKLENIPLNVKIDGFGGRFGKNADGKPFMGTSNTEPRYQAGFVARHREKGTTDPDVLNRAQKFDDLFNEMMNAIKIADSNLGPNFLVDKQVTCEVLFLPFAEQTQDGRLKFVGIEYDQLPAGIKLVLVPFRVVQASTGEDVPNQEKIIKALAGLGGNDSVMFMSNRLVQKQGLDVTEIINPLDNLEELKKIVSDTAGKRDRASVQLRKEVEEKLKPVQIALERAIDNDPNIVGKDMLGQDYEGIVINSRLGPIKITSDRQKDLMAAKMAARAAARAEQGRDNQNKTAVVAIGSFVGHRGHEQLWDYTVKKAQAVGGDPYLFIGNAEGPDDPIPPSVKVQTWHKLYPQYANNISTVMQGGQLIQKIKHELINPLPGKPPRYDNIIIMVGEDRKDLAMDKALMKAVNKFAGYEHVKVHLEATPRGTGIRFTDLRNILKTGTPEQQYAAWSQGFDEPKLGKEWILKLMDITRKGMAVGQKPKNTKTQQDVSEGWSQKYKNSINCSHPRGFSQRAHCAGKKKHNEDMTMEAVCADCGMCRTHGDITEIKKGQKDSNGFTRCWPKHHADGTKKSATTGKRVRNCVPIGESLEEEMSSAIIKLIENQLNELRSLVSHTGYTQLPSYKRYDIFVTKKKFNNIAFVARAEDPRTKVERFNANAPTPQEAVDKLHAKINNEIDVAQKASGKATLDFNVDFVREILEMSDRTFYAKVIPGPKLVIAGSEMENYPEIMKDEGFKKSSIRLGKNSESATKLPGISLSPQEAIRANIIANGRYVLGNETIDRDGNRIFDLEFDSIVAHPGEKFMMKTPAVTVGTERKKMG